MSDLARSRFEIDIEPRNPFKKFGVTYDEFCHFRSTTDEHIRKYARNDEGGRETLVVEDRPDQGTRSHCRFGSLPT